MYCAFFGLQKNPFSIAPDPRFLFMSERHREALAHLLYGLGGSGGIVLLSGEIGAGKTTVSRCFLEQIPENCTVAYIFNPKLTVNELLKSVCDELRITYPDRQPGEATVKDYLDPLNEHLLKSHAQGRNTILIIDEAQNLSAKVLEQLRLLTNLETNERKLLQITLIGQPELRTMLAKPGLEQLAQRVIARFHLEALTEIETASYIAHRLAVAGMAGTLPFDSAALRRIYALSRGVPRRINLLCDRAMLGAFASASPAVTRSIVEKAATEIFEPNESAVRDRSRYRKVATWGLTAAVALLSVVSLIGIYIGVHQDAPDRATFSAKVSPPASAPTQSFSAAQTMSSVASVPALAPAVPAAVLQEQRLDFKSLPRSKNVAWRELAPMWNLALGNDEPCSAARLRGVHCFKANSGLPLVRQLDRPVILGLTVGDNDPVGYALLTGVNSRSANLRSAGVSTTVPLEDLARMWGGEFATLWRVPPGYSNRPDRNSQRHFTRWLSAQLTILQSEPSPLDTRSRVPLKARIYAFQIANEIAPDGVAGPITLMQLNRATGVDEPHLDRTPP